MQGTGDWCLERDGAIMLTLGWLLDRIGESLKLSAEDQILIVCDKKK
mgnify:CR=1 FL=1